MQDGDLPVGVEQIDVRLIDIVGPDANPNLDYVLTDAVRLIERLRTKGALFSSAAVAAQSRTPTVAALYCAWKQGISGNAALRDVTSGAAGRLSQQRLPQCSEETGAVTDLHAERSS